MLLIGQAKEAEEKRNQEMRKFAEDRERHAREHIQLVPANFTLFSVTCITSSLSLSSVTLALSLSKNINIFFILLTTCFLSRQKPPKERSGCIFLIDRTIFPC